MVMKHVIVEIIHAGDTGMSQTGIEEGKSVNWDAPPGPSPSSGGGVGGGVSGGGGGGLTNGGI